MLEIQKICKRYRGADQAALDQVSLELGAGELLALVGESGSGKTSLLRIIAGLEQADQGRISLNGQRLTDHGRALVPPERRRIGLVFQHHALFPHLSVINNVRFGLPRNAPAERSDKLLEMVTMTDKAQRYPHQLSGGEQQRVALARALAPSPALMLLDEPFASLDRGLRTELRDLTAQVLKSEGTSALMVTHHPGDALAIADRIVVLRQGRMEQIGNPVELYQQPVSAHVASLFGACNFLSRALIDVSEALQRVAIASDVSGALGQLWVRPGQLHLSTQARDNALGRGKVMSASFQGDGCEVVVALESANQAQEPELVSVFERHLDTPEPGTRLWVCPKSDGN